MPKSWLFKYSPVPFSTHFLAPSHNACTLLDQPTTLLSPPPPSSTINNLPFSFCLFYLTLPFFHFLRSAMTKNCNGTSGLYCLPSANQTLVENKRYDLSYNADFTSLQGQPEVDLYLYDATLSSLVTKVSGIPNSGDIAFSVDSVCFLSRGY